MAAQVTTVHPREKTGLLDAIGRALQGYQAFTGARENSARTDLINQQADAQSRASQREEAGIITPKEELETAKTGHFSQFGIATEDSPAPEGSFTYKTTDNPDVVKFAVPNPTIALKPPRVVTQSYQDESGKNRIGIYDPDQQKVITSSSDPLAATQPKDLTAGQETADQKTKDKHFQTVQSLLEGMRGNPAIQQAEKDIYSAQKVNALIDKLGGGDLNNLNPQAVQLLVGEIGKIAQGGSPTVHELDSLNPNTLSTKFAGVTQKLLGEPSPANAGEFLKQYKDYADGLTQDAQKMIEERYGRILTSNKSKLSTDDYDALKANYVDRFKMAAEAAGEKLGDKKQEKAGSYGTANAATNPHDHPEADQAVQWAKAHPNDPRSATILNGLRK